jgi:hypothetical protein
MDTLREALQSCLLTTDSKCNVPDPLQQEFNATQLTLGQFLLKKPRCLRRISLFGRGVDEEDEAVDGADGEGGADGGV